MSLFRYQAIVDRVVDGDTLELSIDLGFRVWTKIPIRLRGVNAPELNTDAGMAAKVFVYDLVHDSGFGVTVQSYKDRRSFERWVADVWLDDGRSVADELLAAGHAQVMVR